MPSSGYAAISFTAGEQPTTAKWNLIGSNDSAFNLGTGLEDNTILARHIAANVIGSGKIDWTTAGQIWWQELARVTAPGGTASLATGTFTAKKYLRIIRVWTATVSLPFNLRFNGDTAANYAIRFSTNNGAESTSVSQTNIASGSPAANNMGLSVADIVNVAASEKVAYIHETMDNTSGAGVAPDRFEIAGKWANTAAQITQVTAFATGNVNAGSELIVLGHD